LTVESYDELTLQAVRNNYGFYAGGQVVDGGWGNFGAYEAYILHEAGADLDTWMYDGANFSSRVLALIDASISEPSTSKRVAQDYLFAKELNENGRADDLLEILKDRQAAGADGSFDGNAWGDIPAFEMLGRAGDIDKINTADAIRYILSQQDGDTGAWTASWNEGMVTAQAVRTLKYLEPHAADQAQALADAIDAGCNWLQTRQQENGSFQNNDEDPVVDTAEVIYTLDLLGEGLESWKNTGNSGVDYLKEAMNEDGTFGPNANIAANTEVLEAYLKLGAVIGNDRVLYIDVDPDSATIDKGDTQQFTAKVYEFDGDTADVSDDADWDVDDDDVASIDTGLATGEGAGETEVTAEYDGMEDSAELTIEGGGSPGGDSSDDDIDVDVAVVGINDELLFAPDSVELAPDDEYGLTALGALDATGLDWLFDPRFGDQLVYEVEGQQNEGMTGWMCKVNGSGLPRAALEFEVDDNDQIIWWYSYDMNSNGPTWGELKDGNGATATQTADSTWAAIESYSEHLEQLQDSTLVIKADQCMSQKDADALKEALDGNTVSLRASTGQGETLITDEIQEVALLVPENAVKGSATVTIEELESAQSVEQFAVRIGSSVYEFGPAGTQFAEPVTIGIKVPITGDLDSSNLSPAWYDADARKWVPVPGVIDLETGMVIFEIDHFTPFAVIEMPIRVSFADVGDDFIWAQDAIEILAGQEIISGTGVGFEPQRFISRAEFVNMAVKALSLPEQEYLEDTFKDVQSSDWFAGAVAAACQNHIISGYPDGNFKPYEPITRNEIASVLLRLETYPESNLSGIELNYTDKAKIPAWAVNGIKFTYQAELMNGYEDGTFQGDNSLSRAEAALVLYRYLS